MQAFIWYLLKVGICLAAFWLLYRLLLSRDTFHGLNRAVLLASTVLAFLIPAGFITLPADAPGPEPYTAITPIGDEFRTDRIRTVPTPEPLAEPQAAEPDKPVSAEHRPPLPTLIAWARRRSRCCACWPPSPKSSERYAPANGRASTGIPCSYIQRTIPYRSAGCATSSSRAATAGTTKNRL